MPGVAKTLRRRGRVGVAKAMMFVYVLCNVMYDKNLKPRVRSTRRPRSRPVLVGPVGSAPVAERGRERGGRHREADVFRNLIVFLVLLVSFQRSRRGRRNGDTDGRTVRQTRTNRR